MKKLLMHGRNSKPSSGGGGVDINDIGNKDLTLEFTPESFDLHEANRVFTIYGQESGDYTCLIRTESDRLFKKAT